MNDLNGSWGWIFLVPSSIAGMTLALFLAIFRPIPVAEAPPKVLAPEPSATKVTSVSSRPAGSPGRSGP